MTAGKPYQTQHIAGLDALRGVAIVLVMLRHYVTSDERQGAFGAAFASVCSFGWVGVDAFFVISGYLITRILLLAKNDCSFFMPFYVRRMFRIMPLYCVFLFIFTVLVPAIAHRFAIAHEHKILTQITYLPPYLWMYWLYLQNIPIAFRGFEYPILDVSWSLAIEEQFYLLWPLVVRFLAASALPRVCAGVFLLSIAARIVVNICELSWTAAYVLSPCRLDGFACGGFVAAATIAGGERSVMEGRILSRCAAAIGFVLFGCCIIAFFSETCGLGSGGVRGYLGSSLNTTVGFSALAVFFAGIVGGIVYQDSWLTGPAMRDTGILASVGRYSYCIYLFHIPVGGATEMFARWAASRKLTPATLETSGFLEAITPAVAMVLSYFFARTSWNLLERPCLRLREYICPSGNRRLGQLHAANASQASPERMN